MALLVGVVTFGGHSGLSAGRTRPLPRRPLRVHVCESVMWLVMI